MAKGYWIAQLEITDREPYAPYPSAAAAAVKNWGGIYIVKPSERQKTPEGRVYPRQAIIAFPSYQAALDCYFSEEYQAAIKLRLPYSDAALSIVEGIEE